jgi:glycosyltransferase involved in cell wall biosynthesis
VVTRLGATFRELSRRGHQVLVISPAGYDQPAEGITVVGSPSVRIPFIYGGQPWGLPLPRLARVLDEFKPDLVHAVNPVLIGWAGIRHARTRGVRLVCSYHTDVVRYTRYYHLKVFERPTAMIVRAAHRLADLNLVTSRAAYAHLQDWGLSRVRLWPGAVDLQRFHPRHARPDMRRRLSGGHPERRLILYVGRLASEKSIERLMPLAGGARHLALVGEGPARARLEAVFRGRQVTFVGSLAGADLAAAYASADLFAFPSTTETLGLAVLEALASGLPVVATRTPASAEVLSHAPSSHLVEAGDDDAMVAAVDALVAAPTDREAVAGEARRWTSTWADATEELLSSYYDALGLARVSQAG